MLSTQTKGWVGTGALKYSSAMADSKKVTDNNTEHMTQKQPLRPWSQRCVRKHFPLISFLNQWKIQLNLFLY